MEILTTNQQIRDKIRWVLQDGDDERIILVAFVGNHADQFLDNPRGIRIYCWLHAPGTNPQGLRTLRSKGVELFTVKNLHIKLYWSRRRGAVLGSPNLTRNALSDNVLSELAVYLPPNSINVDSLLKPLTAVPLSDSMLNKYETEYNLSQLRNPRRAKQTGLPRAPTPSFLQWYESKGAFWRLYWWDEEDEPPRDTLQSVKQATGRDYYHNYINSSSKSDYRIGEWVLCFRESYYQNGSIRPVHFEWFIPQIHSRTQTKKWGEFCQFWFQVEKQLPETSPFHLADPTFRKAMANAISLFGSDPHNIVKQGTIPKAGFVKALVQQYKQLSQS